VGAGRENACREETRKTNNKESIGGKMKNRERETQREEQYGFRRLP